MCELIFSTVLAEIKNAFVDEINDPDLIGLLYRGVAGPLNIKAVKVQKGTASKIVKYKIAENEKTTVGMRECHRSGGS